MMCSIERLFVKPSRWPTLKNIFLRYFNVYFLGIQEFPITTIELPGSGDYNHNGHAMVQKGFLVLFGCVFKLMNIFFFYRIIILTIRSRSPIPSGTQAYVVSNKILLKTNSFLQTCCSTNISILNQILPGNVLKVLIVLS